MEFSRSQTFIFSDSPLHLLLGAIFNPTRKYDFVPNLEVNGTNLETKEEMKLLGLKIRNDLSWKSNTDSMVKRAYNKLWMIKRLIRQGANLEDLTDIYVKQVRSILEFGVPVWNSGLTQEEVSDIERVQKFVCTL